MKRIIAVLIFAASLLSVSFAEDLISFQVKYNVSAAVFKAPKLGSYTLTDNQYIYRIKDGFGIMAQVDGSGSLEVLSVICASDDDFADFFYASIAILAAYNQITAATEAALVIQLMNVRMGKENGVLPTPDGGGIVILSNDQYKYAFMYVMPK